MLVFSQVPSLATTRAFSEVRNSASNFLKTKNGMGGTMHATQYCSAQILTISRILPPIPSPWQGNGAQLSHHPFAILGEAQPMGHELNEVKAAEQ